MNPEDENNGMNFYEDMEECPAWFDDYEDLSDDCGAEDDLEGICSRIGEEYCSFWCPFHQHYFGNF